MRASWVARCSFVTLFAAVQAFAFGTYRAGSIVLQTGDSSMRVFDAMGEPRYKEAVTNGFGAPIGECWYYRDGSKTIKFYMSGGRVASIEEIRD